MQVAQSPLRAALVPEQIRHCSAGVVTTTHTTSSSQTAVSYRHGRLSETPHGIRCDKTTIITSKITGKLSTVLWFD